DHDDRALGLGILATEADLVMVTDMPPVEPRSMYGTCQAAEPLRILVVPALDVRFERFVGAEVPENLLVTQFGLEAELLNDLVVGEGEIANRLAGPLDELVERQL